MNYFLEISNSEPVRGVINQFLEREDVLGVALDVHWIYVTMSHSQFGTHLNVNEVLRNSKVPSDWEIICRKHGYTTPLSPVFIVVYVSTFDLNRYTPFITEIGNYLVVFEKREEFEGLSDRKTHRPIKGGISVSNNRNVAGTLGGLLKDSSSNEYILSCNHVLYDGLNYAVLQKGKRDGGSLSSDEVGTVKYYVPLTFPTGYTSSSPYMKTDVAIASVDTLKTGTDPNIRLVGNVSSIYNVSQISLGDEVIFVGKESDRQEANVYRFISRLKIKIDSSIYLFGDLFEIEARSYLYIGSLAVPGDSGSWVIKEEGTNVNHLYGMLIAANTTSASNNFAICCFMETTIDELITKASAPILHVI